MNFGIILSPHSVREMMNISQELKLMQKEDNQPGSDATGAGGLRIDDPTFFSGGAVFVCCSG